MTIPGSPRLGASDAAQESDFRWLNGDLLRYEKFRSGEPNGRDTRNCIQMLTDGKWNDGAFSAHFPYLCSTIGQFLCFSYIYRPETKFVKVMFSQVSVCPQRGVYPSIHWEGGCVYPSMHWGCLPIGCLPRCVCVADTSPAPEADPPADTRYKRVVCIPLGCILVKLSIDLFML